MGKVGVVTHQPIRLKRMIAQETSIVEMLERVDEVWNADAGEAIEGEGYRYESKALFKVSVVGMLKWFVS